MAPTALVTGGAQRTGKAIVLALARAGYHIALHYHRSAQAASLLTSQVYELGMECRSYRADLTREREVMHLASSVTAENPTLHLVVINASLFESGTFLETDSSLFDRQIAIHLKAPFLLIREFARLSGEGCITTILDSKIKGHRPNHMAYLLSKKALAELTQIAARDLAPRIRVNGIAPGPVESPLGENQSHLDRVVEQIPLKTRGYPEDIARAVIFLAENSFITGQILFVDGGDSIS